MTELLNFYEVVDTLATLPLSPAESSVVHNAAGALTGYIGTQFLTFRQQSELKTIWYKYFPRS